jgi:hypothetical protein
MPKHPKRPRDPNQLAKLIVDLATGEATEPAPTPDSAAAELGRKGGAARARNLTAEQRREIARKGAISRWKRSQ